MPGDSLSERFLLLPRATDDGDWDEVLLRAGIRPGTMLSRRVPRFALLMIGVAFVVGLIGAGLIGASLHRAQAAPPGPTHVQREVPNGTVSWLFAHKPRGQSLAQAHIELLSTTGAHWQPVRFARAITPDPHSQVKVVLSLIGKRGRNICMTVYLAYSSGGGCAIGLLLKPFNYDISSHMNPSCPSCSNVLSPASQATMWRAWSCSCRGIIGLFRSETTSSSSRSARPYRPGASSPTTKTGS